MKLPKHVKVGPFRYRVKMRKKIIDESGRQLSGCIRYHSLVIEIDPDAPAQRYRDTLLHELVHAIIHDRRLEQDEEFVSAFSSGLAAVLLDNPAFTRLFLTENGGDH